MTFKADTIEAYKELKEARADVREHKRTQGKFPKDWSERYLLNTICIKQSVIFKELVERDIEEFISLTEEVEEAPDIDAESFIGQRLPKHNLKIEETE